MKKRILLLCLMLIGISASLYAGGNVSISVDDACHKDPDAVGSATVTYPEGKKPSISWEVQGGKIKGSTSSDTVDFIIDTSSVGSITIKAIAHLTWDNGDETHPEDEDSVTIHSFKRAGSGRVRVLENDSTFSTAFSAGGVQAGYGVPLLDVIVGLHHTHQAGSDSRKATILGDYSPNVPEDECDGFWRHEYPGESSGDLKVTSQNEAPPGADGGAFVAIAVRGDLDGEEIFRAGVAVDSRDEPETTVGFGGGFSGKDGDFNIGVVLPLPANHQASDAAAIEESWKVKIDKESPEDQPLQHISTLKHIGEGKVSHFGKHYLITWGDGVNSKIDREVTGAHFESKY